MAIPQVFTLNRKGSHEEHKEEKGCFYYFLQVFIKDGKIY